jgi:DNA-binding transcriptional ArsR family regulator
MSRLAATETTFTAVASPVRRKVLDLLKSGEKTVSALTDVLDISQPAVSQHLAALRDAGLVEVRRDGRFKMYRLTPEPLAEVFGWVRTYEAFWEAKLDALGRTLDEMK